jgi:hypothetical protein
MVKERNRKYNGENKDKINQRRRQHRAENKDKINERRRQHRAENKDYTRKEKDEIICKFIANVVNWAPFI